MIQSTKNAVFPFFVNKQKEAAWSIYKNQGKLRFCTPRYDRIILQNDRDNFSLNTASELPVQQVKPNFYPCHPHMEKVSLGRNFEDCYALDPTWISV